MNQFIDNETSRQQALDLSNRLGALAAEKSTAPPALPTSLSTILRHIRQRNRKEKAEYDLRANHFIMAD